MHEFIINTVHRKERENNLPIWYCIKEIKSIFPVYVLLLAMNFVKINYM